MCSPWNFPLEESVYLTSACFSFRIGVSVKQQFTEEEIYKDRDSQISAIEKTFEDAQKSVSELITRLLKSLLVNCRSVQQGPACNDQLPDANVPIKPNYNSSLGQCVWFAKWKINYD